LSCQHNATCQQHHEGETAFPSAVLLLLVIFAALC